MNNLVINEIKFNDVLFTKQLKEISMSIARCWFVRDPCVLKYIIQYLNISYIFIFKYFYLHKFIILQQLAFYVH
jgi:hypothetical protein